MPKVGHVQSITTRVASIVVRLWVVVACVGLSAAEPTAPRYEELRLDGIFPAGGQRGHEVVVEFRCGQGGIQGARDVIIDGPPGITVRAVKELNGSTVQATLAIAPDAAVGRRWLRLLSERVGLTNFAYFVVGALPEGLEQEPNNQLAAAQAVTTPVVLNGRINPKADADWYRFSARAGQRIVAAIAAHVLDIHGQASNYGIADFRLELFDGTGRTLATSEDVLGLDPLIEWVAPADGEYLLRVELLNYQGFPEAVYRLTLGQVPYATAAMPLSVRRGEPTDVLLSGPNLAGSARQRVAVPADATFPLAFATLDHPLSSGCDVPLAWSDERHLLEIEPDSSAPQAMAIGVGSAIVGSFESVGDEDWYRVTLVNQQAVWLETIAHRWTRLPVDTRLEVFDAQGQLLVENDDDATVTPGYESIHDYQTTDSRILFRAPAAGDYLIRVTDQSGASGPRAAYRLNVTSAVPDFQLRHFPDGIPVWGPGSTAAVLVRIDRLAGYNERIDVAVEGLPDGWHAAGNVSLGTSPERAYAYFHAKVFLTITAPANAVPGTCVPLRIVGRGVRDGQPLVRESYPLTLFYTSDTGFFRVSPQTRAVVTRPQGPWLEALTHELRMPARGSDVLRVRVHGGGELAQMPLVVNIATGGVACVLTTPRLLPVRDGVVETPIQLPAELAPGEYGITVAQTWRSDIRIGMPGPCTSLIRLTVTKP